MLDLSRIRAITLDLDDTLWPIGPTIVHAETQLQQWLAQHAPQAGALVSDRALAQRLRQQVQQAHPERLHDLSFLRLEAIRALLSHASADPALAEPAFEVFFAARQQVQLYDDALAALTHLAQRFPLVALSNGNADVHRVGLGAYFSASVSAREVGVAKPDRRIFEAGAQAAGVAPHDVLHIGDDAHLDAVGGMAAGMQVVWLNRAAAPWPTGQPRPHWELNTLQALCQPWPTVVS